MTMTRALCSKRVAASPVQLNGCCCQRLGNEPVRPQVCAFGSWNTVKEEPSEQGSLETIGLIRNPGRFTRWPEEFNDGLSVPELGWGP